MGMTPTRHEIADLIDGAHDVFLVRGRCVNTVEDEQGRVCIIGALSRALKRETGLEAGSDLISGSLRALGANVGNSVVSWNYDATDDEVFDLLKRTSKELRDEATP